MITNYGTKEMQLFLKEMYFENRSQMNFWLCHQFILETSSNYFSP